MTSLLACIAQAAAALILPIAACAYASVRLKTARPALLGAACFYVFQCCIRMPLLQYVLPMSAGYTAFTLAYPVLYTALLALSAGVFEECGRYLVMRRFMRDSAPVNAVAFGLGHGGIEAIRMVGVSALVMLVTGGFSAYTAESLLLSGAERLFAMAAHVGLSVMVLRAACRGRTRLLPAATALHGLVNFAAVYLMQLGAGLYIAEAAVGACSAALLAYAICVCRKQGLRKEDSQ